MKLFLLTYIFADEVIQQAVDLFIYESAKLVI